MKSKNKKQNICTKFLLNLVQKFNNLSFKQVFMITLIITAFVVTISAFTFTSNASIDAGITKIEAFDKLEGHGEFLSSKYRNNYYLDIVKLGITDVFEKASNGIANIFFSLLTMFLYLAITAFYYCFNVNIADLFKNIIDGMQLSLKQNIFDNLFILVFAFLAIYLVKQVFKRNTAEIVAQISKVIFVSVLASLLTTETGAVLSASTEIAKNIGGQSIFSINGTQGTGQELASSIAGELWYTMGHQSWLMIEGGNFNEEQQKQLLEKKSDDDERIKMIKAANEKNGDYFNENIGIARVPQTLLVLVVVILKAGVLLLLSLIQLAFQVLAVFCILLSVVALVLALVPQLGGLTIIENLVKRIFETQLGIVITTFILATVTKMDTLIMNNLQSSLKCGWLIALILQSAIYVCVFIYRKQILKLISTAHHNIKRGHVVPRNIASKTPKTVTDAYVKTGQFAGKKMYQATGFTASKVGDGVKYGTKKAMNLKDHLNKKRQEKEDNQSPIITNFPSGKDSSNQENGQNTASLPQGKNKTYALPSKNQNRPVLYLPPPKNQDETANTQGVKNINNSKNKSNTQLDPKTKDKKITQNIELIKNIKVKHNIKTREKLDIKRPNIELNNRKMTIRKINKDNSNE